MHEYFDIKNDRGQISKNDFYFKNIIQEITSVTSSDLFVFSQEEVRDNLDGTLEKLEKFMEILPQNIVIDKKRKSNVGINKEQANVLLKINKFNKQLSKIGLDLYSPFLKNKGLTPFYIIKRRLNFLPKGTPLKLPDNMKEFIQNLYKNDLEWTKEYIKNQNKKFGSNE